MQFICSRTSDLPSILCAAVVVEVSPMSPTSVSLLARFFVAISQSAVRQPQGHCRYCYCCRLFDRVKKQSRYRPRVAQRVPGSLGSQISWQRHRMVVRLFFLRTCCLYPKEIQLVLISVRNWVDPNDIVRPEGLCHWKIPVTPWGIEPRPTGL